MEMVAILLPKNYLPRISVEAKVTCLLPLKSVEDNFLRIKSDQLPVGTIFCTIGS